MEEFFFQPRFSGGRFEDGALPVSVTNDLRAYERLLISLAKSLYLQEHPDRKRIPKYFSDVSLDIVTIGKGSSALGLTLSPITIKNRLFNPLEYNPYFFKARDAIAERVASEDNSPVPNFPEEMRASFNQLGLSLQPGESMLLPRAKGEKPAALTPDRRKQLVLAASPFYKRNMEGYGYVAEANWDDWTLTLRFEDGACAAAPMTDQLNEVVGKLGGNKRDGLFYETTYSDLNALAGKSINDDILTKIDDPPPQDGPEDDKTLRHRSPTREAAASAL